MAARWRTQTTNLQSIAVEACWRPMEGDVAGDFYDVVDLKDGRVAVVVGDAPGFGPRAASLADELRAELRHALRETTDAPTVLERLDKRLRAAGEELIATVACAVIDPQSRVVQVANAGHPPIVVTTHSGIEFLKGSLDPPLGVEVDRHVSGHSLPADATLFLYTDGLIERRGTSLGDSLDVLREACHGLVGATAWASELARRATERLGQPSDDATVVSVRLLAEEARRADSAASRCPLPRRRVDLRVYVDPGDLRSAHTEAVVRDLAYRLQDRFDIHVEVVDITAAGTDTQTHGILAAPTVVRVHPEPPVRVIGGLRSVGELAQALQLPLPEEDG